MWVLDHEPRGRHVEMEDRGLIGVPRCDCAFARAGLSTVIRDVANFGKLTGHGVILVGTDIVAILEERLPAALGARVGDFQLGMSAGRRRSSCMAPFTLNGRCVSTPSRRRWSRA